MTGIASHIDISERRVAAAAGEIALVDGAAPKRIQLLRMGDNAARDGRKVYRVVDLAHAEAIVAASNRLHGSTQPMVDYDHQSVYGAKDGVGGRAPAAGWMTRLVADNDGVHAEVEWTRAAQAALGEREYRYISPYFGHAADGRVTRIFNAALTNRPELELRAAASQSDGDSMEQIISALGLAAGATLEQVLEAIRSLTSAAMSQADRTALCTALGLKPDASLDEMRTAASSGAADVTKYVPITEFNALRGRLDTIETDRVTASVDDAIAAGKVTPASRDWALGYAKKDPEGFAAFVGKQPAIVMQGAEERRAAAIASDTLTDEERAICSAAGIAPEAFLKSRKGMSQ